MLFLSIASTASVGCVQRADYALVDGFEELCDGVPCNWVVQAGSSGTATYQETLPGEHGLRLVGGPMALLRDLPGVEVPDDSSGWDSGSLRADVAARCDDGSNLAIEVTIESLATGAALLLTASSNPPRDWDGTLDAEILTDESSGFGTAFRDVLSVRIVKDGTGTCELDYFALRRESFGF